MNHTIPYTSAEQDKTIANAVNHAFRHCRIGKVTEKPKKKAKTYREILSEPVEPFKWPSFVQYFGREGRKCACPPGAACGNVACPYALIATC